MPKRQFFSNNPGMSASFCSVEARGGQSCFLSGLDLCALLVPLTPQQTLEKNDAQSS